MHGEVRQMYKCNACGQTFSEIAETAFFGIKAPIKTRVSYGVGDKTILSQFELCFGCPVGCPDDPFVIYLNC